MIQLHKTPQVLRKIYPDLIWEKESTDEIFLTFDDGPHPEVSNWVMDTLKQYEARATFFCVGQNLQRFPEVAKRAIYEGHVLANHTHDHSKGWQTDNQTYYQSIEQCKQELTQLQGHNKLFRPPYGRIRKKQIGVVNRDYQIVMWSHLSWDFDRKLNVRKAIDKLKGVGAGSIVVFHDSEKSVGNLKKMLPGMLDYWSSVGLKFNTL